MNEWLAHLAFCVRAQSDSLLFWLAAGVCLECLWSRFVTDRSWRKCARELAINAAFIVWASWLTRECVAWQEALCWLGPFLNGSSAFFLGNALVDLVVLTASAAMSDERS